MGLCVGPWSDLTCGEFAGVFLSGAGVGRSARFAGGEFVGAYHFGAGLVDAVANPIDTFNEVVRFSADVYVNRDRIDLGEIAQDAGDYYARALAFDQGEIFGQVLTGLALIPAANAAEVQALRSAASSRLWAILWPGLAEMEIPIGGGLTTATFAGGSGAVPAVAPGGLSLASATRSNALGRLFAVNVDDAAADALAARIGGRPSVRFELDASGREFDAVSDLYVAQTKPGAFKLGSSFRRQARATFESAIGTGRRPYFHFEGPPDEDVIRTLKRYAKEYGVEPIIDTRPLG
jgi:hypothetical protein